MQKTIHSKEYQIVVEKLRALREAAGMTQRDLAAKLDREHSFVWRMEKGERRLDVVEFHYVCQALGTDASELYRELLIAFHSEG
ncbi:MAG: helix-turn-helix transcriptional regulator [Verrucomicrobia bacterium]|nr:helix-turn-helix transcriptional regulator [Verrucomicrobiota bacterium]MCH8514195.1 helix-turn-helix domain-containing protein [Kiritimatiellia bacterium]